MKKEKRLVIEITEKCAQNCMFCSTTKSHKFMETADYMFIIEEAKKLKFTIIEISGGEPFNHKHINLIIRNTLKMGFKTIVNTCGLYNNDYKIKEIPIKNLDREIIKNKNFTLRFNFQTIDILNFAIITGLNNSINYFKVIDTIKYTKKLGINIEINIIPNLICKEEFNETIKYLIEKIKVNKIKILKLITHGNAEKNKEDLYLNSIEINNLLKKLEFNSKIDIGTGFYNSKKRCNCLTNKLMIDTDLNLFPCVAFKNQEKVSYKINYYINRTITKAINSNKLNKLKQKFSKNVMNKCRTCKKFSNCEEICIIQRKYCKNYEKR